MGLFDSLVPGCLFVCVCARPESFFTSKFESAWGNQRSPPLKNRFASSNTCEPAVSWIGKRVSFHPQVDQAINTALAEDIGTGDSPANFSSPRAKRASPDYRQATGYCRRVKPPQKCSAVGLPCELTFSMPSGSRVSQGMSSLASAAKCAPF